MKKIYIEDISGRVENYDLALYDAIKKVAKNASVSFFAPGYGLLSLIPKRWQYVNNIIKRLVKVVEGLLNYAFTCIKVDCDKPDVLHLQWLPFLEVWVGRFYSFCSPRSWFGSSSENKCW